MISTDTQIQLAAGAVTSPTRVTRNAKNAAPGKAAMVEKLLARPRGVTMVELISATGWQNHSVRAFLSGLRKKGRVLAKEARKTGEVAYRLSMPPTAAIDGAIAPAPDAEVA